MISVVASFMRHTSHEGREPRTVPLVVLKERSYTGSATLVALSKARTYCTRLENGMTEQTWLLFTPQMPTAPSSCDRLAAFTAGWCGERRAGHVDASADT